MTIITSSQIFLLIKFYYRLRNLKFMRSQIHWCKLSQIHQIYT